MEPLTSEKDKRDSIQRRNKIFYNICLFKKIETFIFSKDVSLTQKIEKMCFFIQTSRALDLPVGSRNENYEIKRKFVKVGNRVRIGMN